MKDASKFYFISLVPNPQVKVLAIGSPQVFFMDY
jgi:hypothetical protein